MDVLDLVMANRPKRVSPALDVRIHDRKKSGSCIHL